MKTKLTQFLSLCVDTYLFLIEYVDIL